MTGQDRKLTALTWHDEEDDHWQQKDLVERNHPTRRRQYFRQHSWKQVLLDPGLYGNPDAEKKNIYIYIYQVRREFYHQPKSSDNHTQPDPGSGSSEKLNGSATLPKSLLHTNWIALRIYDFLCFKFCFKVPFYGKYTFSYISYLHDIEFHDIFKRQMGKFTKRYLSTISNRNAGHFLFNFAKTSQNALFSWKENPRNSCKKFVNCVEVYGPENIHGLELDEADE